MLFSSPNVVCLMVNPFRRRRFYSLILIAGLLSSMSSSSMKSFSKRFCSLQVIAGFISLVLMMCSVSVRAEQLCEFMSANQWASFDSMPKIKTKSSPKTAQEYYDIAVKRYFENLHEGRVTQSDLVYKHYLESKLDTLAADRESAVRQIKNKIVELEGDVFDDEIRTLFFMAAQKGHKVAQFCLGRVYEYGVGVPISYVDSYSWYAVASSQLTPGGDALMWGVSQRLEATEVSLAEKRAKKYIQQYTGK